MLVIGSFLPTSTPLTCDYSIKSSHCLPCVLPAWNLPGTSGAQLMHIFFTCVFDFLVTLRRYELGDCRGLTALTMMVLLNQHALAVLGAIVRYCLYFLMPRVCRYEHFNIVSLIAQEIFIFLFFALSPLKFLRIFSSIANLGSVSGASHS